MNPSKHSESLDKKVIVCPKCRNRLWDDFSVDAYEAECFVCHFSAPISMWRRLQEAIWVDEASE